MHYYQFHIADFALHTMHLSLEEEAVYRRLLDFYYDTEQPIPEITEPVIRRLRLVSQSEIVASILAEFFVLGADGWRNRRADQEISEYHGKAERARKNGKGGGRPKKNKALQNQNQEITQPVILANLEITGSKANQEPITINQEPVKEIASADAPAPRKVRTRSELTTLKTYLERRKAENLPPMDDDCPANRYAASIGLPPEFLLLAWREFRYRHTEGDRAGKRQKSWPQTFANAVRDNWYKLWWLSGETYELTTAGRQADLARRDAA